MSVQAKFEVEVLNRTLAVFDRALDNPFNDWTRAHMAQGFTWRAGSVSFLTLESEGALAVDLLIGTDRPVREDAVRAIQVPFSVGACELVEITSIDRGQVVGVPQGHYVARYETGQSVQDGMWCCLTLVPSEHVEPAVLKADPALSPPEHLIMEARPAGP